MERLDRRLIEFLKKKPKKWFTSRDIALDLKLDTGVVLNNLSSLYKHGYLLRKQPDNHHYIWRIK